MEQSCCDVTNLLNFTLTALHCGNVNLKKHNIANISKTTDTRKKRTANLDSAAQSYQETSQHQHKKKFLLHSVIIRNLVSLYSLLKKKRIFLGLVILYLIILS